MPDLRYRAVAEVDGWDTAVSPTPIVLDSGLTTSSPPITLRLTSRSQRAVTITLNATADTAGAPVNLAGAAVLFHSVSQPPGTPPNADLSNFVTGTGPYTVAAPHVPTGTWTVAVTPSGAPFGAYQVGQVTVVPGDRPAPVLPPDTRPQPPPILESFSLVQALVTTPSAGPPPPVAGLHRPGRCRSC